MCLQNGRPGPPGQDLEQYSAGTSLGLPYSLPHRQPNFHLKNFPQPLISQRYMLHTLNIYSLFRDKTQVPGGGGVT